MEPQTLNFTFTVERVNLILAGLAELPFRIAAEAINDVREQATAQVSPEPDDGLTAKKK